MAEAVIAALFDKFEFAAHATDELVRSGIPKERIALLANNMAGDHPGVLTNPSVARPALDERIEDTSEFGTGIAIGAGLGAVAGVLLGASSLTIPGVGPALAIGAWAAAATGIGAGAIIGGLVGALIDHGVSVEDAELYAEGLRRGGTLVSVRAPEDELERIAQTFQRHGAVDIERRAASWRAEGWVGFDREAQPFSAADLAVLQERERAAGHEVTHHRAIRHYFLPGKQDRLAGISSQTNRYAEDMIGE